MTLAALGGANVAGRASTAVDNATKLAVDYILGGKIRARHHAVVSRQIEIWLYGRYDGVEYPAAPPLTPTSRPTTRPA